MSQNGQTHFKNLLYISIFLKCVWPFGNIMHLRVNGILRVKKSENDKPIIITHDEDLWGFSEQEQQNWKCFSVRFHVN